MLPIDGNSITPATAFSVASSLKNAAQNDALAKGAAVKDAVVKDSYLDQNALNVVKAMGRKNDPQALKEIAKKFEGMFVQQMLKSMREANDVFSEGNMFSSGEVKFHQEMLDQQMVINLTSGKGIGLATTMYQQMLAIHGKNMTEESTGELDTIKPVEMPTLKPLTFTIDKTQPPTLISRAAIVTNNNKNSVVQTPEEFVATLMPYAKQAAEKLKIKPDVLLAQAALETGWGKHVIHDAEGNSSFNMFIIKKTNAWNEKSVGVKSLEYKNGIAKQEHSEFRQYNNYLHSFSDYVNVMKTNPRYQQALNAGADSENYADALQKAGYATDPDYAEKIKQLLMNDAIRSATNTDYFINDSVKSSAVDAVDTVNVIGVVTNSQAS